MTAFISASIKRNISKRTLIPESHSLLNWRVAIKHSLIWFGFVSWLCVSQLCGGFDLTLAESERWVQGVKFTFKLLVNVHIFLKKFWTQSCIIISWKPTSFCGTWFWLSQRSKVPLTNVKKFFQSHRAKRESGCYWADSESSTQSPPHEQRADLNRMAI